MFAVIYVVAPRLPIFKISGSEVSKDLTRHPATIRLQNIEMVIVLLIGSHYILLWKAHRIYNLEEGSLDP